MYTSEVCIYVDTYIYIYIYRYARVCKRIRSVRRWMPNYRMAFTQIRHHLMARPVSRRTDERVLQGTQSMYGKDICVEPRASYRDRSNMKTAGSSTVMEPEVFWQQGSELTNMN